MPIVSKIKVGDATWLRDNSKGTKEPFVKAEVTNSQQGGKRITAKNSKTGEEVRGLPPACLTGALAADLGA